MNNTAANVRLIRSQWISFKSIHGRTFNDYLMFRFRVVNGGLARLGLKEWRNVGDWLGNATGV